MLQRLYFIFLLIMPLCANAQMISSVVGERQPWTAEPQIKGERFRFIILPDRTGGEQEGIFDEARDLLNSNDPDFFITIGDLIDGYTQDSIYLQNMWHEYFKSIQALKAPVFFIPGNHDISNKMQEKEWINKFGYTYYYFIIANNLFLILDSENGGIAGISDIQSKFFLNAISQHAEGKNIFVFMHRPLWMNENNMMGYEAIDSALVQYKDQTYVFSGHEHRYLKIMRNDIPHYMVATLGGGNELRSLSLGEFHHFLVLDVDRHNVFVRNILHTGEEIADDIVNNHNLTQVDALSKGRWFTAIPSVSSERLNKELDASLFFRNKGLDTLKIKGDMPISTKYFFSEKQLALELPPLSSDTLQLILKGKDILDLEETEHVNITLNGSYFVDGQLIEANKTSKLILDYKRRIGKEPIDIKCINYGYIKEDWDWKGLDDGMLLFSVKLVNDSILSIEIGTKDDKLITNKNPYELQDKLFFHFSEDLHDEGSQWMLTANNNTIEVNKTFYPIKSKCWTDNNSLKALIEIPLTKGEKQFRLNIGFMDHDNPLNTKPSILWWKPLWNSINHYLGSGVFIRE